MVPPEVTATVRASRRACTVPATRSQTSARLELGELVGRVLAREHAQHGLEGVAAELGEVLRPAHDREQLVDRPGPVDASWPRSAGPARRAGCAARRVGSMAPSRMQPGHHRRLQQVAAVLGEDDAARRLADLVAGTAHPLQPAGHRQRRLDLDDEVDRAHVDAQLQRRGGHDGRQPSLLELLLDDEALLAGDGAVVGPGEVLAGQLVEVERDALREPAAVGEDDGAAVRPDELEDARVDRGPDAGPGLRARASGRRATPRAG